MRTNIMNEKVKEKMSAFIGNWGCGSGWITKNITPLYGIAFGFRFYPMVCPWAPNGALSQYLQLHHSTLPLAEMFQILDDVASGLQYLHSNHVTHGDLTGNNILMFGDGGALKELWGSDYFTWSARGTLWWAAPELFQCDEESGVTGFAESPSDVYSFGSIILQGVVPFVCGNHQTSVSSIGRRNRTIATREWVMYQEVREASR
ncbi:kinase-like domain-containing protein [Pisolithus orientalis]|uniref:kinase-like domain-containing protein n=1 Tax=Pisolithus orientalis TaxID=936130 RepID=UPI0022244815|nr:kinase-like domain-containing protein [Pisolithus orientalis]KAI5989409.1 kinase-like domain-containing protein [Pisolithus orientalis]